MRCALASKEEFVLGRRSDRCSVRSGRDRRGGPLGLQRRGSLAVQWQHFPPNSCQAPLDCWLGWVVWDLDLSFL